MRCHNKTFVLTYHRPLRLVFRPLHRSCRTLLNVFLDFHSLSNEDMASEIIFGQLRLTVATLTIEQINQDREVIPEARSPVTSIRNCIRLDSTSSTSTSLTSLTKQNTSFRLVQRQLQKQLLVQLETEPKHFKWDKFKSQQRIQTVKLKFKRKNRLQLLERQKQRNSKEIAVQQAESESKMGIAAAVSLEEISVQEQQRTGY